MQGWQLLECRVKIQEEPRELLGPAAVADAGDRRGSGSGSGAAPDSAATAGVVQQLL